MRSLLIPCTVAVLLAHVWAGYEAPAAPEGTMLLETFQGKLKDLGWIGSEKDKYEGEFKISAGKTERLEGDTGLFVPDKAMHYALSKSVDISEPEKIDLVVQYQVKYDDFPTCGGAYLKFPAAPFSALSEMDNEVPYSIMFGPDKCGSESKVHLIIQQKNPKTGEMVEHHLKYPPQPPADRHTHLFTLVIRKDETYDVLVDLESKKAGSLREDFEPPFAPPKEIDDPNDKKPEDWEDEEKIEDPDAKKPDDWDEDAPRMIPDPDAKKPEGWLEDEPTMITDPSAKKPDDWDEDEDGEWEPPQIENPKCAEVGCGEWKAGKKKNPAFKGKWQPPLIKNPAYRGIWKPKKIENPNYYELEKVNILPISAVGFEIWTMDKGYIFDNLLIGTNPEGAKAFAEATWSKIKVLEDEDKEEEMDMDPAEMYGEDYGEQEEGEAGDYDEYEEDLEEDEEDEKTEL